MGPPQESGVGRDRAPRHGDGVVSLVVAAVVSTAVIGWMMLWAWQMGGPVAVGYLGCPIPMLAAAVSCLRAGRSVLLTRPVRAFWRRFSHGCLLISAGSTAALIVVVLDPPPGPDPAPGLSLWAVGPMLAGLGMAVLAFGHLPLGDRSGVRWVQLALDGGAVALAGALFFWYLVLDLAPPGMPLATQIGAALVGVGSLVALVVIGKAAISPDSYIDVKALHLLALGPLVAVTAIVLLIATTGVARMAGAVLAIPLAGLVVSLAAYKQQTVARRPRPRQVQRVERSVYNALPYLAVSAAATLLVTVSARQMTWHQRAVVVGAVAIAALVVTRQLLGLHDNDRLLRSVRLQQARLEHQANHDPLTGLANRARFGATLAERLNAGQPASVLLIDVDDFRMVNDTLGHSVGDELLMEVAYRLRAFTGPEDLPARLGGDEFAVFVNAGRAEAAAERIMQGLSAPVTAGTHQLLVYASIGVATAQPGDGPDDVVRNADIAMYAAKDNGKASWARFEPWMRHDIVNHARLGGELHQAIRDGQLYLDYQPVFDLNDGRLVSAEALVRWRHPERGIISPGEFIPVAERTGLILPLGSWVLWQACRQVAKWEARFGPAALPAVGVNVAARQLRDPGFVAEVREALRVTGVRPEQLIIEVTETSVLEGPQVRATLQELSVMGLRLALDDFGTGQSSLSLVRAFPIDVLKLDKSFVDGIEEGDDRGRLAVAAAVAQLASTLGLGAVAEGIENRAQLERLRELGYQLGQGFHLARPMPAPEIAELLTRRAVTAIAT
jgi:diguanylate cyclase (GGDEF)-like protein